MAARLGLNRALQRIWDALTVPILAAVLVGVAIGAVIVYATTKALDPWMPNVATGALSIAITITVVDKLIRRADDARIERRRQQAYRRLAMALVSLTQTVLMDYVGTHLHSDIEMSGDPAELLKRWREDDVDTPRRPPPHGARPFVLDAAVEFATDVKRVADADHDVLPDDLLTTMSEIDARLAVIERMDEQLERAERLGQLLAHYESAEGGRHIWQALWILEAAEQFAATFRRLLGDEWSDLFNRPVSIAAVPAPDDSEG